MTELNVQDVYKRQDMATREELASAGASTEVLCRRLGADSLRFLEVDDLCAAYGGKAFCFACFDGGYRCV